jgi:hypothetical protein
MSQFNFPRINFHGSVLLDVATANNGRFSPLMVYNQQEAAPYEPPRIYFTLQQKTEVENDYPGVFKFLQEKDSTGEIAYFLIIATVNTPDLFIEWAVCNLGTSPYDKPYWPVYKYVVLASDGETPLNANWIQPGYWNYFGDMSVNTEDVKITGVQLPNTDGGLSTWTPGQTSNCPQALANLLGGNLSFNEEIMNPSSRSTAVFCDMDSEGDTCTQLFIGNAGVYNNGKLLFSGLSCKSTFSWLGLTKVLNWADSSLSLAPMSGSAVFYSTIELKDCDPDLKALFNQYAGQNVTSLFMKLIVHEVYEVHNPDYTKMPTSIIGNNRTNVPKNPARAFITGNIGPLFEGNMRTNTICRIIKNSSFQPTPLQWLGMTFPTRQGDSKPLTNFAGPFVLPPAFLNHDKQNNLLTVDLTNTLPEYGIGFGPVPSYGGATSIPAFLNFETLDMGTLSLNFTPDGSKSETVASFTHQKNYNMANYLATGGMIDIPVAAGKDYSNGDFSIVSADGNVIMLEDPYLVLSDQQATYAEQGQSAADGFMSDGLPKGPVMIRAFYRGEPILPQNSISCTVEQINFGAGIVISQTPILLCDNMPFRWYDTETKGCLIYNFATNPNQQFAKANNQNPFIFKANGYYISTRVLSSYPILEPYLSGQQPITWDVVYKNVFSNYHLVLPIMNAIIPFKEEAWNNPFVLRHLLEFISEDSWNQYQYMPVTRELSSQQRQLLTMWAKQNLPDEKTTS